MVRLVGAEAQGQVALLQDLAPEAVALQEVAPQSWEASLQIRRSAMSAWIKGCNKKIGTWPRQIMFMRPI